MAEMDGESMNLQQDAVANQAIKIGAIWAAIGITTWAEAASFLAFLLSLLALSEYLWKKMVRPSLVHFGYLAPRARRKYEAKEYLDEDNG